VSLGVLGVDVELQLIMMKIENQFMKNIMDPSLKTGQTTQWISDFKDEYGDTYEDLIDDYVTKDKSYSKTVED